MSTVTSTYFRYIQIPFLSILRTKKKESKCFVVRFLMRPGAECSPERLEAGPAFGFGPLAALLNLPPLLHPLWAALKKKQKKKKLLYIPTSIQVHQSNQFSSRFEF